MLSFFDGGFFGFCSHTEIKYIFNFSNNLKFLNMATKFFAKINAGVFFLLACVITLVGCDKADVGDEAMRTSKTKAKNYTEVSKLTNDDTHSTANLEVSVEYFIGEESQGKMNANADAICSANPENDNIETANMNKTFVVGAISTPASVEGSSSSNVFCDIKVLGNGEENVIKTKVTITPGMAWDRSYTLKVSKIEIDEAGVKMTEVAKKAGESGRQAILVPVKFYIDAVGTEEARSCIVTKNVRWEQYQTADTPEIDHEEIAGTSWKVNADGTIDYMVKVKQIWTEGHEDTFVEYPYASTYVWNVISLEDMTVKSWAYGLKNIEGLTAGTPAAVPTGKEFFTEKRREDIYSAIHANGQDANIKCVYFCEHPEVTFTKGDLTYTFSFISPSFDENGDDLLDGTSAKSGYDLRIFRNSVTGKYGNQTTSIQEKVLEERCNLYKAAKAVKGVELISATTEYPAFAVDFTAKYRLVYNDDTKSDVQTITTSRPWTLTYDGSWTMTAKGDVNQSTTAIVLTKGESKTEEQTIANGKWVCTSTGFTAVNNTTVDNQVQKNGWKMNIPTKMSLFLYDTEIPFEIAAPKAEAKDIKITLTNSSATSETYKFSENLNVTVGTDTEVSEGTGTVTKAVEITVTSWEWNAKRWFEGKNVKAFVERIYHMSDGSTKTVRRDFNGTINSNCYTYFETTETSNQESTGAAQFVLVNTESKSEGDWKFDYKHSQLNFGITYAGSTQKDGWNIYTYDNLSCTIDGETYTFTDPIDMSAQANSTQTKKSEDENKTTYEHSNAATFYYGGSAIALDAAKGLIFVAKTVIPDSHNGFFPKEYGKMEGYNRVACRNPHNQKDWGVGISVKFTNGSVCGFITKDGNIEWGSFESGSTTWDGASPDDNGNLYNCTAKDASAAMKWMHGTTINMLSYTDGTLMGFNDGNNTVSTSKFPGTIQQQDGGKWQILTISGVNGSWDSSF